MMQRTRRLPHEWGWSGLLVWAAWAAALICTAPAISVVATALLGTSEVWGLLTRTVLPRYLLTTLELAAIVAVATAIIGTGAAWLVTSHRFPGRRVFEIALALPLAFPAYVLAYAYTDLLDHPGPVQSALRAAFDLGPRDYWFPEVRSLGGAAAMLTLVLYPYVYLLARAAFIHQSVAAYDVARTLGCSQGRAFWRVSLPMARPAIAAGVALALMETIADFGTVAHFGVQTFATGIYKAWFSMGDRVAAAQLSACLLAFALALAAMERIQRGAARRHQAGRRYEALPDRPLSGWRAGAALAFCAVPVLFGFVVPVLTLGLMAWEAGLPPRLDRYLGFIANSVSLAGIAAALTVGAAILVGYAVRWRPGFAARAATLGAGLGYAIPGGVMAVGLLVPLAHFDNALDSWARAHWGVSTGLIFTGSIAALVLAYVARFMAAALGAVESGLTTIGPSIDAAARTLGRSSAGALRDVHAPLLRGSLLTAALIVFVDVIKELPATLIMRPFDFDTLAVQTYRLAADERLLEAALPSLMIMAFGLIPVTLLARAIRRSRPGSR